MASAGASVCVLVPPLAQFNKDRNSNATSVSISPRKGCDQSKFCVDCL